MRALGVMVFLCLVAAASAGCKNKGDADAAPDPAALKAQQELIAKRDALLAQRTKLQSQRDEVVAQIKDTAAKGGDTAELEKKRTDLENQLDSSTADLIGIVNNKLDAMKQTGDKSAAVASREAEIGSREKALADREARVAQREAQLATRESEAAQRWKDTCSAGAAPVIIQQAAPKGGNYTKKDVSDLIAKARATMSRKGLINSDLPGPAQALEAEAGKALNENDMSKAYFAAAQFAGTVDSIQVNRAFIQAKTARLSAQLKSSKVDEATNQQLADILRDVMQKYNDGDFTAANRRLNQLAAMLK